jgi:hypothetical protein
MRLRIDSRLTIYRLKKIDGAPKRNAFKLKARIARPRARR